MPLDNVKVLDALGFGERRIAHCANYTICQTYNTPVILCISYTVYQLYNLLEVQGTSVVRYVSCAICQLYIRSSDLVVYDLVALVD